MTNIVERLRSWNPDENEFNTEAIISDAAAEIEQLQATTRRQATMIRVLREELAASRQSEAAMRTKFAELEKKT